MNTRNRRLAKDVRGSVAGNVIAFFGVLVIIAGLATYFYEEEVGIFRVYTHRDLGIILIPTGIVLLFGGIALHAALRRRAPTDEGFVRLLNDSVQISSSPSLKEVSASRTPSDIKGLKALQSEIEGGMENIDQEISALQQTLSEAKEAVEMEELSADAYRELEARKLREIERLNEQRASEEATLFELGMKIRKKRSEIEKDLTNLDEHWNRYLCSSCFGTGMLIKREYHNNYIILINDPLRSCSGCNGSGRLNMCDVLTAEEMMAVEAARDRTLEERIEWYSNELEYLGEKVRGRKRLELTLQSLNNVRQITSSSTRGREE